MNKKTKSNSKNKYIYTLTCKSDDEYDKNVGDYIVANNMQEAYDIAMTVCNNLNSKYAEQYFIQSVMPD